MFKRIWTLLCSGLLLATLPAAADSWNKKTTVTFAQPVELPGVVLPAGSYVFKLLDSTSNRHIVQVFNADETKVFATILAIPNWRLTPAEKTVMPFEETPRGNPEALRAWFYPGDNFGQEFVYPKKRAVELAETTHSPVLMAEVTPTEKPEQLINEPVVTFTPERKEVETTQVIPPPPAQPTLSMAKAEPAPEPVAELPATGSFFPLLILVGVCSLGIVMVLKAVSKRSA